MLTASVKLKKELKCNPEWGNPMIGARIKREHKAAVEELVAAGRFPDRASLVRHAISDLLGRELATATATTTAATTA